MAKTEIVLICLFIYLNYMSKTTLFWPSIYIYNVVLGIYICNVVLAKTTSFLKNSASLLSPAILPIVNIDMASAEALPVIDFVALLLGKDVLSRGLSDSDRDFVALLLGKDVLSRELSDSDRVKIKKALSGLKVEVTRGGKRKKYRVSGLTTQPTRELVFPDDDNSTMKSVEYFQKMYGVTIQHTHLPCLQVVNQTKAIPLEVCKIVERDTKRVNDKQITALSKVTSRDREDDILQELCIDSKIPQQCLHPCHHHKMKSITGYFNRHPQHKLVRVEKDAMFKFCEYCKARIFGLSSCYKCNDCNEYLHEACLNAEPNSTKPYPFNPNFHLKFSTKEIKEKQRCTACCSDIEGIMYTGSHANKKYSLHPPCLELSANVGRAKCEGDFDLELKVMERFPEMPTDMKCEECRTKDGEGWCYCIKSNREFISVCHVRCRKERLANGYLSAINPVKMADTKQYIERIYRKDLEKFRSGLASELLAVGLDLMISTLVGGPVASIISVGLAGLAVFLKFGKKYAY